MGSLSTGSAGRSAGTCGTVMRIAKTTGNRLGLDAGTERTSHVYCRHRRLCVKTSLVAPVDSAAHSWRSGGDCSPIVPAVSHRHCDIDNDWKGDDHLGVWILLCAVGRGTQAVLSVYDEVTDVAPPSNGCGQRASPALLRNRGFPKMREPPGKRSVGGRVRSRPESGFPPRTDPARPCGTAVAVHRRPTPRAPQCPG